MFEFLKRKRVPTSVPPEQPSKSKQYILKPTTVGVSEGIYCVVYQNEYTDDHWCFGSSLEVAVIEKDKCTLMFPVDRKYPIEGQYDLQDRRYIPQLSTMKGVPLPLSNVTPGLIAQTFLPIDRERLVERPTLWYEANIEKVLWDEYKRDRTQEQRN